MKKIISGFFLAAGLSSRMDGGRNKLLLPLSKGTVLEYSLRSLLNSSVDEVIAVVGNDSRVESVVRRAVERFRIDAGASGRRVIIVKNTQAHEGMATSIRECMKQAAEDADGFLFMLADLPKTDTDTIDAVAECFRCSPEKNIVPVFGGRRGHPVIISSRWKSELFMLKGDLGGREIIRNHPDDLLTPDLPDDHRSGVSDIDTESDYFKTLLSEMPVPLSKLLSMISDRLPGFISFSGGGGKTSFLVYLAGLLAAGACGEEKLSVIMTTTTKMMGPGYIDYGTDDFVVAPGGREELKKLKNPGKSILWLGEAVGDEGKYGGPGVDEIYKLTADPKTGAVLIEADGSAGKPVKVPGEHEPAIPPFADVCISVIGLSALNKPVGPTTVHRPGSFQKLIEGSGLSGKEQESVSADFICYLADHPDGSFKNAPEDALRILVFNQCDTLLKEELDAFENTVLDKIKAPHAVLFTHMEPFPEIIRILK